MRVPWTKAEAAYLAGQRAFRDGRPAQHTGPMAVAWYDGYYDEQIQAHVGCILEKYGYPWEPGLTQGT